MKKCVIYGRQSVGENDISESVEIQKERCMDLARNEHLSVVGVYEDLNTSGKTYPKGSDKIAENDIAFIKWFNEQTGHKKYRSGLQNVLNHLNEVDFILVYDITRLYRPVTGSFLESYVNQLLIANNVKIWTVNNGVIDVNNFSDALITSIQNQINHEQLAIQRKKAIEALRKLRNNGELHNGIWKMYGYRSTGRKREVEIVEDEAEMVKDIYNTFLNTNSLMATTRIINKKYEDKFKSILDPGSFKNILINPVYCGYMYDTNNNLIVCKQVIGKEIIKFEQWEQVQKYFELRKVGHPRNKKSSYPLSSLVYCGKCGMKMLISKASVNKFYRCVKSQRYEAEPCGTNIYNSYKSKYGLGLLEAVYPLLSLGILDRLNASMNKEEQKIELNEAEVKLQNLKNKEKNITDVYLNGTLDENVYKETLINIKKDKDDLIKKINKLKLNLSNNNDYVKKALMLLDKIAFRSLTYAEFTTCLYDVVKRIEVFEDKVKIITVYGEVTLPRQVMKYNKKTLPHYYFFPQKKSILVYYYMGEEKSILFNEQWKKSEHKLMYDFDGRMKIFMIK